MPGNRHTEYAVALSEVPGLGPQRIRKLLDICGSLEEVFSQAPSTLQAIPGIPEESVRAIGKQDVLDSARQRLAQCHRKGIHVLTPEDERYPQRLREIHAAPYVLYVRGNTDVLTTDSVAVVGTRRPSGYGTAVASHIAGALAQYGITVVSGLARGIDTVSHKACVARQRPTIAVCGCGLDHVYPPVNKRLAQEIAEYGALVAEFPLGVKPEPHHFPLRNRIISGLTYGTLVVEAGKKSGALITAYYALQQNRDVFSVPGSIFSAQSDGPNELLHKGAIAVRHVDDILTAIRAQFTSPRETVSAPADTERPQSAGERIAATLSEDEHIVYRVLSQVPKYADQIAEESGLAIADVLSRCLTLEIKGVVSQVAGQQFVRI
jgi:DNA processing protein